MIQASLFFAAFIGLLLGFFVFVNNPRATLFRLYFAFSVTSSAWTGLPLNEVQNNYNKNITLTPIKSVNT